MCMPHATDKFNMQKNPAHGNVTSVFFVHEVKLMQKKKKTKHFEVRLPGVMTAPINRLLPLTAHAEYISNLVNVFGCDEISRHSPIG